MLIIFISFVVLAVTLLLTLSKRSAFLLLNHNRFLVGSLDIKHSECDEDAIQNEHDDRLSLF